MGGVCGELGPRAFLDGNAFDSQTELTAPRMACGQLWPLVDPISPDLENPFLSENDWIFGAGNQRFNSNSSSINDPARVLIDEVRFRDEYFTAEEARLAFESVDLAD